MKAVVISGSPHSNGTTARMTEAYLSALPEGFDIVRYSAYEMGALPCLGCGACNKEDRCVYDDLEQLDSVLLESDVIVISTPVYYRSFPAPMKAVIDRMQRYYAAAQRGESRFAQKKRKAVLIASAGAPSEKGELLCEALRWVLPSIGAQLVDCIVARDIDRAGLSEEVLLECRRAAENLKLTEQE